MATKMSATEITARINKAQETLNKLVNLIAKREAKLETLKAKLEKASGQEKERIQWDIDDVEYAISENKDKIPEREKTIKFWQEKLEKANAETKKLMEMPEQLKELHKQIETELIEYNTNFRNEYRKDYKEMNHEDFKKKYRHTNFYKVYYQTDEEIVKDAKADAKSYVLDLVSRVQNVVGEITNWDLHICGNHLNGKVTGTSGRAKVETILAGGYNIQCLHNRVLVNRIK